MPQEPSKSAKKSISFFSEDLNRIESFPSQTYGGNISGKIQEMVQDLHFALARTRKEIEGIFMEPEWMYMRDMMNGSLTTAGIPFKSHLEIQIEDSDSLDSLGEKWSVDVPALLKKVNDLTEFQAYAVIKDIHAWWNEQTND